MRQHLPELLILTVKWWDAARYQQVVNRFRGRIDSVQVGETHHHQPDVCGVTDLPSVRRCGG